MSSQGTAYPCPGPAFPISIATNHGAGAGCPRGPRHRGLGAFQPILGCPWGRGAVSRREARGSSSASQQGWDGESTVVR